MKRFIPPFVLALTGGVIWLRDVLISNPTAGLSSNSIPTTTSTTIPLQQDEVIEVLTQTTIDVSTQPDIQLLTSTSIEVQPILDYVEQHIPEIVITDSPIMEIIENQQEVSLNYSSFGIILVSCSAIGIYSIWKFATRRTVKFYIASAFSKELTKSILDKLNQWNFQVQFQPSTKSEADILIINGDLALRADSIVPDKISIYLSVCEKSNCAVSSNEVRIFRVGNTIKLTPESIRSVLEKVPPQIVE